MPGFSESENWKWYTANIKWYTGTAWKVSKYGVFSGPYIPVFGPNTGKYGPEKTPYVDNFHAVWVCQEYVIIDFNRHEALCNNSSPL